MKPPFLSPRSSAPRTPFRRKAAALLTVAALAAGLAACGPQGQSTASGAGNKDVATGGKLFTTADAETAKLGTDAKPGEFPRTVKHSEGETLVQKKPARVVVLDSGELDDVLALGITPVGMAVNEGQTGVPSYLADKAQGIRTVGSVSSLDLEAIAALHPDMILGSKLRADALYKKLSDIAPTVFSIRPGFPWKENLMLVGAALGEETKAVGLLNDYQERADALKKSLTGDPTISLVRFRPGQIRLYSNYSFIGVILKDIGLPRPKIQDVNDLAVEISQENIGEADADRIFYSSYGPVDGTDEKAVTGGRLWANLGAVKSGNAQRVDDDVWFLGLGPIGAQRVLADLKSYLG